MKKIIYSIIFILCAISTTAYADKSDKVYVMGIVPQFEARRLHNIWRPILDTLEQKTGYKFKIRGSSTIPEFEKELAEGKFDFAYMNHTI